MTPTRYQLRPFRVDAMRWEPHLPEARQAMLDWLASIDVPARELPAGQGDIRLSLPTGVALPGCWVVRNRDGRVFTLTAQQFAEAYEPAAGEAA